MNHFYICLSQFGIGNSKDFLYTVIHNCFTLCKRSDPRGIYCDDIVTCSGSGKEYNQETQGLLIYLFLYWIAFRTVLLFTQNQIIETQGDIEFIHGTIL